ncbi:MAG: polysaccharide lyase [Phycisphaeraceae bacterium]
MYLRVVIVAMVLCCVANTVLGQSKNAPKEPLIATDFEQADELGLFKALSKHALLDVVEGEGVDGSKGLRTKYVGYKEGSKRVGVTFDLPKHVMHATLNYDVKFDRDFQFVKGGKMHGLSPDKGITGGKEMKPEGWSARVMWRDRGLNTYVYSQDKNRKYGEGADRTLAHKFRPNRYHAITIYVKLNDPVDKANGSMRIYVDGRGVADHRGIQFRSVEGEHTKISKFLFSTFHGGHDPSWAPKDKNGNYITVYAYFDNFAVYEGLNIRRRPVK